MGYELPVTLPATLTLGQLRIRYHDARHTRPRAVLQMLYGYDIMFAECLRDATLQRAVTEAARVRMRAVREFPRHAGFITQYILSLEADAFERMGDKERSFKLLMRRLSHRACVGRHRLYSYWRLGDLQLAVGRESAARESYRRGLQHAPRNEREIVKDIRNRLRGIERA